MLNISSVMIGTHQTEALGEFYAKVFGREADMKEYGTYGWKFGSFFFTIMDHSEVKDSTQEPQRMIFNLETSDVKGEFERIKKELPEVKVIKEPYTMEGWEGSWIATLADLDGNYFQLATPWESDDSTEESK